MTAIREGACRSDNPLMAWPDVQPPAYRAPKPTNRPPIASTENPFNVNKAWILNSSSGCKEVGAAKPRLPRSFMVSGEICTGTPVDSNSLLIKPPMIAPTRNIRFHFWVFQLNAKNLVFFPSPAAAQIVLRFAENPND